MAFGIDDAIAAGLKIVDKFIPDPEARAKAGAELRDSLLSWDKGQLEVNKAEASHSSIFVAGWRPYVGWVCGAGFTWTVILRPVLEFTLPLFGVVIPDVDIQSELLMTTLLGMLGMGGLRTFEKMKGVARKDLNN